MAHGTFPSSVFRKWGRAKAAGAFYLDNAEFPSERLHFSACDICCQVCESALFVSEQYPKEIVSRQFRPPEEPRSDPRASFALSQNTRIEGETEDRYAAHCFARTTLGALFLMRFN